MFNVGGGEMIVLGVLALLVFGPEGLPGIIKNVMQTVNAVKRAARDLQNEVTSTLEAENRPPDPALGRRTYVEKPKKEAISLEESEGVPELSEEDSGLAGDEQVGGADAETSDGEVEQVAV